MGLAYIIHYSPLTERREHIDKQFQPYSIVPHYIECYNREDLTDEHRSWFTSTGLNDAEISLFCKHLQFFILRTTSILKKTILSHLCHYGLYKKTIL